MIEWVKHPPLVQPAHQLLSNPVWVASTPNALALGCTLSGVWMPGFGRIQESHACASGLSQPSDTIRQNCRVFATCLARVTAASACVSTAPLHTPLRAASGTMLQASPRHRHPRRVLGSGRPPRSRAPDPTRGVVRDASARSKRRRGRSKPVPSQATEAGHASWCPVSRSTTEHLLRSPSATPTLPISHPPPSDLSTHSAASTARVWLHGAPALTRRVPLDRRIYLMTLIVVWRARAPGRAR